MDDKNYLVKVYAFFRTRKLLPNIDVRCHRQAFPGRASWEGRSTILDRLAKSMSLSNVADRNLHLTSKKSLPIRITWVPREAWEARSHA